MQALCPNLSSVAFVVSWFGDDLRAGQCTIAPRVEKPVKEVLSAAWGVAGLTRVNARVVSQLGGGPAMGGTPSDDTVIAAIRDLKARGLSVVFYPSSRRDRRRQWLARSLDGGRLATRFPLAWARDLRSRARARWLARCDGRRRGAAFDILWPFVAWRL